MSGGTFRVLRGFSRCGVEVKAGDVVTLERAPRDPSFFEPVEQPEPATPVDGDTVSGDGSGEALPPIDGDAKQAHTAPARKPRKT